VKPNTQKLVGICELYYETCPSYITHSENNIAELEKRLQELGIPVEDVHIEGCQSDRMMSIYVDCRRGFRQYAHEYRVTWCFEYTDFPCQWLRGFTNIHIVNGVSYHTQVINDLQYTKRHSIEVWVEK
jgi:hypothetical protein